MNGFRAKLKSLVSGELLILKVSVVGTRNIDSVGSLGWTSWRVDRDPTSANCVASMARRCSTIATFAGIFVDGCVIAAIARLGK